MDRTLRQPVLRAPDLFGKSIQSGARIEGIRQPASERCEHPQNQKSRGTPDESPHECQSIPSRNRRFKHRCKAYPALRRLKQAISKRLGAKKSASREGTLQELNFDSQDTDPYPSRLPPTGHISPHLKMDGSYPIAHLERKARAKLDLPSRCGHLSNAPESSRIDESIRCSKVC